ncbi:hypothetical protein U1Q18_049737 [Sarracenia purpurea var. burkii]
MSPRSWYGGCYRCVCPSKSWHSRWVEGKRGRCTPSNSKKQHSPEMGKNREDRFKKAGGTLMTERDGARRSPRSRYTDACEREDGETSAQDDHQLPLLALAHAASGVVVDVCRAFRYTEERYVDGAHRHTTTLRLERPRKEENETIILRENRDRGFYRFSSGRCAPSPAPQKTATPADASASSSARNKIHHSVARRAIVPAYMVRGSDLFGNCFASCSLGATSHTPRALRPLSQDERRCGVGVWMPTCLMLFHLLSLARRRGISPAASLLYFAVRTRTLSGKFRPMDASRRRRRLSSL